MPGAANGFDLRPATEADLPACERIWRAGLNGYLGRLGIPEVPEDNPGLRRLHAHTLATDPARFWVAARRDPAAGDRGGRVVAFGSAVERGPVWFLSMLFVEPSEQGHGLGRAILERIRPGSPDAILATATDSAQPISNALYASFGIVPRMPMVNLVGRPGAGEPPARLPPGITAAAFDGDTLQSEVDRLDREVLGFEHPADHAFAAREGRLGFAYRDASGDLVGYGYAAESGRVGPIAVRDEALLGPALAHILTAVIPRGASSVWLPGLAGDAMRESLLMGLRLEEFPILVCWNRPFADFSRYIPISPGLL